MKCRHSLKQIVKTCGFLGLLTLDLVSPQFVHADAANNFVMNKFVFGANERIAVDLGVLTIDSTDFFVPASNIFVISSEVTALTNGMPLLPLDPSGVPNVFQGAGGGGFFDETVGFTEPAGSIGAGIWHIVEDANQNGIFDLGLDSVLENAFSVELVITVDSLPDAAIIATKDSAGALSSEWDRLHDEIDAIWAYYDAVGLALAATSPARLLLTYFNQNQMGLLFGTDPKAIAKDIMLDTAGHYAGIAADPPDPQFRQLNPLGPRQIIDARSDTLIVEEIATLGSVLDTEKILLQPFLASLERYQGAAAAGNGDWALIHARAIKSNASLLAAHLIKTNSAITTLSNAINADASDLDGFLNDFQAMITQLSSGPFTASQLLELQNLGLSAAEIEAFRLEIVAEDFSSLSKAGFLARLATIQAANADYILAMNALSSDMNAIIANLISNPIVNDRSPIADGGGPYVGNEGSLIPFDGSSSSSPADSIVSYEWDLDFDGAFDDATGPTPAFSYDTALSGLVGLKVTDSSGRTGIDYVALDVSNVNSPPEITGFTPLTQARLSKSAVPNFLRSVS